MTTAPNSLGFGHHSIAVLGAAILGSTAFALISSAVLAVAMGNTMPGTGWLVLVALLSWLAFFIVALPGTGLVLSLLWHIIRRRTLAGRWICLLAGATTGIALAPLTSPQFHGATLLQLGASAATGIGLAALYLILADRFGRVKPAITSLSTTGPAIANS